MVGTERSKLGSNDSFKELGKKSNVGDGPVVGERVCIQGKFLQDGFVQSLPDVKGLYQCNFFVLFWLFRGGWECYWMKGRD